MERHYVTTQKATPIPVSYTHLDVYKRQPKELRFIERKKNKHLSTPCLNKIILNQLSPTLRINGLFIAGATLFKKHIILYNIEEQIISS